MSQIRTIIESLNIPEEKLKALAQALNENPMSAMTLVQELNIPPQILQDIMALVMSNPEAIKDFAKSLGINDATISALNAKLGTQNQN